MSEPFFSMKEARQPVNQWLCIAFMGVMCFWTVLYYFTHKAEAIADSYTAAIENSQNLQIH